MNLLYSASVLLSFFAVQRALAGRGFGVLRGGRGESAAKRGGFEVRLGGKVDFPRNSGNGGARTPSDARGMPGRNGFNFVRPDFVPQNTEASSNEAAFLQDVGQLCTQSSAINCRCQQQLGDLKNFFPAEVQACIDGRVESATITRERAGYYPRRHGYTNSRRWERRYTKSYNRRLTFTKGCEMVNRLDCLQQHFINNPDLDVTVSAILPQLPEAEFSMAPVDMVNEAASLCEPIIEGVEDVSEQVQRLYECTKRSLLRQCQENLEVESSATTTAAPPTPGGTGPSVVTERVERLRLAIGPNAMDYCSTPLNATLLDLTKARAQISRINSQCKSRASMFMQKYRQCRSDNLPEGVTEQCRMEIEGFYLMPRFRFRGSSACFENSVYQDLARLTEDIQTGLFCTLTSLRQMDTSNTLLGIDVSSLPAAARAALSERVAECPTTPDPADPGCLVAPFLDVCDIVQGQQLGGNRVSDEVLEACRAERATTTQATGTPVTTGQPPDTPEPFVPPVPEGV